VNQDELVIIKDSLSINEIDALSPAKAAFYSAFLPGLGQAYNRKFWKIPIVYAGLGIGMAVYLDNDRKYKGFPKLLARGRDYLAEELYLGEI
jgi:hypothetical protein